MEFTRESGQQMANIMTTTVALITTTKGKSHNVMAAEWAYMVAKIPPHLMVSIHDENVTGGWIADTRQFGVTFCSCEQAALANFAGSYSWNDVTKLNSDSFDLYRSRYIQPYLVRGGLLACECRLVDIVRLPEYRLFIGEVVRFDIDETKLDSPLVKHGAMYSLGKRIDHGPMVISADTVVGDDGKSLLRIAGRVAYELMGGTSIQVTIIYTDGNETVLQLPLDSKGYFYTHVTTRLNVDVARVACDLEGYTGQTSIRMFNK